MRIYYRFLFIIWLSFIVQISYAQCGLDVFVANDQSGSVDAVENSQGRHFITELMRNLDPWGNANNQSRMAIAEWDYNGSWTRFNFPSAGTNYTTQLSDVIAFQNSPRILSGGTDPYSALLKTYNAINQTPIVGRTANQVIILMTDAYCNQIQGNLVQLATQIKDNGIYIMVMAIDAAQGCTILQGENIASDGAYFSAPSYAQLEQQAIAYVKDIISAACIGPPPPSFDLTINLNNFTATNCLNGNGTYKVDYTINNIGKIVWNNNMAISFYNGDPTLPTTKLIAMQNIGSQTIAVNGSVNGSFTSNLLGSATNLYSIVNFNGNLATNTPPLPYNLKDKLVIVGERNEKNNFSNGISRINDISCKPKAVLNIDVQAGGIGCDNTITYEVEICNTGDATAIIDTINPIAPPNFILKNMTNIADTTLKRIWATYYGGSYYDFRGFVSVDAQGNIYLSGGTSSSNNISTIGAHQSTYGGGLHDAFLVKFTSNGVRQWATYYGGSGWDVGNSISVDAQGNVYMAGTTSSTDNISTAGAHQTTFGSGDADAFLVKFNSNGVRQWATYYGGNNFDDGTVSVDAQGNVYMAGRSSSTDNISTAGAHQTISGGSDDAFLVKFNNNGVRQWATYYGGNNFDVGTVIVDAQGNVYMAGRSSSTDNISTAGAHQTISGGSYDAFLVKFNNNGVRQWASYYGGFSNDYGNSVSLDAQGNVYMVGSTGSTDNISTVGAHQTISGGSEDAFLVKFNNNGVRQWATYYGGFSNDYGNSVSLDAQGNVYMVGQTRSTNNISTTGAYQTILNGSDDAFLVKFNSNGVRSYATYYGGNNYDVGMVSVDAQGNVYIAGQTESTNNISTSGTHQTIYGGGSNDTYLVKFGIDYQIKINPNECIKRQYTYTYSGVPAGTYNYSVGITASKFVLTDGTPVILPDSNFIAGTFTNIDGFNGAVHTSDNVTISGNTAACATGDKVNVNVSIPTASGCGGGNYVQATVTINNTSGVTMFNPKLYLNLTGTGATFAGEIYNLSNNLSIPAPNILATVYPNVANALYGKTGVQTLPIYQLPAGTSTFTIDINLGSVLTNLGVRVDSLPTIFNSSGSSNLASDAQGVSIPALPTITGFSCPAAITAGNTITFSGISVSNASTIKWASTTLASIANTGSLTNPSLTYTPTPTDLANGFVAISLTANNSAGCDATRSCQVAINNVVYDYGDAPITYDLNKNAVPYAGSSTLLSGIHLGISAPTTEATAKNSTDAKGDGVEEDGLLSSNCTSKPINLQTFPLQIKATNSTATKAYISAFADWNNDGDYLDDGETSIKVGTVAANSGTNNYTLNFRPETANASLTQYFVRLRISTDSNSIKQPYEPSPQGEIEDHIMKLGLSATYKQFTFDICLGDSVKVNNKTYKTTGTYYDTLVNSVGCDSVITVKLTVNPKYNKTQKIDLCQGGSIKVGTNTYTLTGTYTDSLKTSKNCDSIIITNLTIHPKYNLSKNVAICPGGKYVIGTHTYIQPGTYKDTLKTSLGCDSVVTTTISVAALQTVSRTISICSNEKLVIGNHTYTTNGIYKDTIKGDAGCDTLLTTTLTVYPKPIVNLGKDVLVCPDSIIVLNASNVGANYSWNNGQITQQINAINAGTYVVTVSKDNCSTNDTVVVQHKPIYKVNLGIDAILCNKDSILLNAAVNGGSYIWQDGSILPRFVVKQEGIYYVQVTTECLVSSDTINVIEEECDCQYYIPNAFSPNSDGIHDVFGVVNTCTGVTYFKFEIFNRWGELKFQANNEIEKWDGSYKNEPQPIDDYVYILTYQQKGKDYYKKGSFSLLK